jgi:general secretion pathway protein D
VPFLTGSYSSTGVGGTNGAVNPFQTIQRSEVGTILKVTPQLNGSNTVILKIELESSNIAASSQGAVDLITNKRTFSTNVMIEDGGIVVLGGLIQDTSIQGEQRVPFLGRIPIIGLAFKTRNAQKTRNNLMVFIRPKILRDGVQTSFETDAKYNYIREEQKKQNRTEILPLLPGTKKPLLEPPPPPPPPGTGEVDPRVEQEKLRGGQGDASALRSPAQQPTAPPPSAPSRSGENSSPQQSAPSRSGENSSPLQPAPSRSGENSSPQQPAPSRSGENSSPQPPSQRTPAPRVAPPRSPENPGPPATAPAQPQPGTEPR